MELEQKEINQNLNTLKQVLELSIDYIKVEESKGYELEKKLLLRKMLDVVNKDNILNDFEKRKVKEIYFGIRDLVKNWANPRRQISIFTPRTPQQIVEKNVSKLRKIVKDFNNKSEGK